MKIVKNPKRGEKKLYTPYVPQHKALGIEPLPPFNDKNPFKSNGPAIIVNGNKPVNDTKLKLKPLAKQLTNTNVPYAETISVMDKSASLPNVGNNVENVWNSVDSMIIDDISELDENAEMIDNNDFVSDYAFESNIQSSIPQAKEEIEEIEEISNNISIDEDEYLIAVEGTVISTGTLNSIQNEVSALVLGEHEICGGKQIPTDDIIVLKRVKIKMGVFLDV